MKFTLVSPVHPTKDSPQSKLSVASQNMARINRPLLRLIISNKYLDISSKVLDLFYLSAPSSFGFHGNPSASLLQWQTWLLPLCSWQYSLYKQHSMHGKTGLRLGLWPPLRLCFRKIVWFFEMATKQLLLQATLFLVISFTSNPVTSCQQMYALWRFPPTRNSIDPFWLVSSFYTSIQVSAYIWFRWITTTSWHGRQYRWELPRDEKHRFARYSLHLG